MNKSTFVIGGCLILFGLFFLMQSLNLIWIDFGDLISFLVPFGLIGFGVWLIVRRKDKDNETISGRVYTDSDINSSFASKQAKPEKAAESGTGQKTAAAPASPVPPANPVKPADFSGQRFGGQGQSASSSRLRYNKTLGDMYIDCKGLNLSNVEISLGVGDLELKLDEGILSKGLNRVVISGFVGDIRIFVSKKVPFFSHCTNFIGDINLGGQKTSGFGNTLEHNSPDYDHAESKLYVAANIFIGDIKVYEI